MKIISIYNIKGGIGKTTIAHNIAAALAKVGKYRTLLIDLDSQQSLTKWLMGNVEPEESTYELISGKMVTPVKINEYMSFIPSSTKMGNADVVINSKMRIDLHIKKMLTPYQNNYDFIVIDCPPAMNHTMISTLAATDILLAPVLPEPSALDGLYNLSERLREMNESDIPTQIDGIIINKFDNRSNVARNTLENLYKNFPGKVFKNIIRKRIILQESYKAGEDIFTYCMKEDKDASSANDFFAITKELLEIVNNKK